MTLELIAITVFSIYMVYVILATYNGKITMNDRTQWYIVNVTVFKVFLATVAFMGIMLVAQSYRIDDLKKEVQSYEQAK